MKIIPSPELLLVLAIDRYMQQNDLDAWICGDAAKLEVEPDVPGVMRWCLPGTFGSDFGLAHFFNGRLTVLVWDEDKEPEPGTCWHGVLEYCKHCEPGGYVQLFTL